MRLFALSAVGRDRPGIVAAVSRVLLDHSLNIEDSQMTILRGRFAMTLIVAGSSEVDLAGLKGALDGAGRELELDAVTLNEVTEAGAGAEPVATHIISVYGADHPGIVHAVATALATRGWTITDMTTRLAGEDERDRLYAMMIEVGPPPAGGDVEELERAMAGVAGDQGIEITTRPLDRFEL